MFSSVVWPHQRSVFDSADQLEPFCCAFAHSHRVCMRVSGALWFLPQVQTHAGYIALKCACRFECLSLIKCLHCNIQATCLEYSILYIPCLAQCLHVNHLNMHILVTVEMLPFLSDFSLCEKSWNDVPSFEGLTLITVIYKDKDRHSS